VTIVLTYFLSLERFQLHVVMTGFCAIMVALMIFMVFVVDHPFRARSASGRTRSSSFTAKLWRRMRRSRDAGAETSLCRERTFMKKFVTGLVALSALATGLALASDAGPKADVAAVRAFSNQKNPGQGLLAFT